MTIRYKYRAQGRTDPVYLCQRSRIERGAENCQYIPGACVDDAIGDLLIDSMTPLTLEVALEVQRELQSRLDEADKLRKQQVQRAEYEANLARRRFMQVDPDHRLVADTLEAVWNEKLRDLEAARNHYEKHHQLDLSKLSRQEEEIILGLARDFPTLWRNPKTPVREKKRMIRLLLEDVTMIKEQEIILHVRFKGGANKTLKLPLPPKGWQHALTSEEIVRLIDELMDNHSYLEIAEILNERGYKSGTGRRFDRKLIGSIRANHDLRTRYARLRKAGKLTASEMAGLLGVTTATVRKWTKTETLKAYPYNDRNECLYEHPGINSPLMRDPVNGASTRSLIN